MGQQQQVMNQQQIIRQIKDVEHHLRLHFDPNKLVQLYQLIEQLK